MEKSKVYFTDMRARVGTSIQEKLDRLMEAAGIGTIDMADRFVAIKVHFGEPGNLAFLRPNFSKTVADVCKRHGGMPFLTDCNTLYVGRRRHALEHLDAAFENGFSPLSTGCHMIIADGLKGTDDIEVPVKNGELVQNAKIGRAIMDADVVVSLNHFKGHELSGFGGALKNLGMGCGSRAGKKEMHNNGKPYIEPDLCRGCGMCIKNCAQDAIHMNDQRKAYIDQEACAGCGRCIGLCRFDAIDTPWDSAEEDLVRKIAEYAQAVCQDRPNFHINIVMDVSPYCDCHGENDAPIIQDIGMYASFDPVALDQACIDAVNAAAPLPNSLLSERIDEEGKTHDHFHTIFRNTHSECGLEHGEKIGLGQRAYEIINID